MGKKKKYRLRLGKLDFISAVDRPAQETARALLLKRGRGRLSEIEHTGIVAHAHKQSDELGLVFCWAFTSKIDGADYYDLQGDAIDEDSIVEVAADFMENSRAVDEMHDGVGKGTTVFAMPWTAEIAKAFFGIDAEPGTTGLMVAIKPPPDIYEKFKSGEYTGVSIGGAGMRAEVEDEQVEMRATHALECDMDEDCTCGAVVPKTETVTSATISATHWGPTATAGALEFSKRGMLTTAEGGHTHLVDDEVVGGAGRTSYEDGAEGMGHSHPYVIDEGGVITIGEAMGHTHAVASNTSEPVEARAPQQQPPAQAPAETNEQENDMNEIETLKVQLARANKLAALTDAEKAHLATLDDEGQDSFLSKSRAERADAMKRATEADEVVYTAADGTVYRKSHDMAVVAAIKTADEANAKLAAAEERERSAVYAKRAIEELSHLPGTEVVKAALLRSVDTIADTEQRAAALELLKAADAAQGEAFKRVGKSLVTPPGSSEPLGKLNAMAEKYAAEHGVTTAVAFAKVCATDEGRVLYAEHRASITTPAN